MTNEYKNSKDFIVPPHPERSRRAGGGGGYEILVFKTNLIQTDHISKVMPSLNHHPNIIEWNVDLHDCDKVLRVVSQNLPASEVEQLIFNAGFYCSELI